MWPWEKKENSPAAADRRKKKEGTDAKQLRPKADQVVSSVSAALSLVNSIDLLLKRRLRPRVILTLVYFSSLVFWRSFDIVAHQRSCVPYACQMRTSMHHENSTGTISMATRPGVLDSVTSLCPDDVHLTWRLEKNNNYLVMPKAKKASQKAIGPRWAPQKDPTGWYIERHVVLGMYICRNSYLSSLGFLTPSTQLCHPAATTAQIGCL